MLKPYRCFHFCLILCIFVLTGCVGSKINFQSYKSPSSLYHSNPLNLAAYLSKPEGKGPFPALVLLHGCAGIQNTHHRWAGKLNAEGYVTLIVDSLWPRRLTNCGSSINVLSQRLRSDDAYSAMRYLKSQPFVNPEQIGVIGWSHGGGGVLMLSNELDSREFPPNERFDAAVAFYPNCTAVGGRYVPNTNLLILIGDADDLTPSSTCEALNGLNQKMDTDFTTDIIVFKNATHSYDVPRQSIIYNGHTIQYNKKATDLSWERLKNFLKENML